MNKAATKAVWIPRDIDYGTQILGILKPCIGKMKKGCHPHLMRKINHTMPRGIRNK